MAVRPPLIAQQTFPLNQASAAMARSVLAQTEPRLESERYQRARQLVSEIVTAFVKHSESGVADRTDSVRLRIFADADCVRIEAFDSKLPFRRLIRADEATANLVSIIDGLSDGWGLLSGQRAVLWFELGCAGGDADDYEPTDSEPVEI